MSEKRKCGFWSMSAELVRAIASKGGKTAHAKGTAHKWTSETAREAGRKGGKAPHCNRPKPAEKAKCDCDDPDYFAGQCIMPVAHAEE